MERVIKILQSIDRKGMDSVIDYLRQSNYATARGGSHHTYKGGLVDHSLEVYNLMLERRGTIAEESVAICALLHDLGKTRCADHHPRGKHPARAIAILKRCGLSLTADEHNAILHHHTISRDYLTNPLRHCLSSSDMTSTGKWKLAHPATNPLKQLKNSLLYTFSKW